MQVGGYTCHQCLKSLGKTLRAQSHVLPSTIRSSPSRRLRSVCIRPKLQHSVRSFTSATKRHNADHAGQWVTQEKPGVEQGSDLIHEHPSIQYPSGRVRRRDGKSLSSNALLEKDNLFHPFSRSPAPEIRKRAAFMKMHAYCPHPSHNRTRLPTSPRDPESRKPMDNAASPAAFVKFECPDCGIPAYCSEEHWTDDYESHMELCDSLREINEDDHDLRSGRFFPEFEYPYPSIEERLPNMSNWDAYLYTREHEAVNELQSLRQVTRLLTYPITIASIIHELSPYHIRKGGRLTTEGLKTLTGKCTSGSPILPTTISTPPKLTNNHSPPLHPSPT